jgi:imidazolonepropionase-like amidohydrolase
MNVPAIAAERKLPFVLSFGTRTEESQLAPTFALAMLVKTGLSEDSAMKSVTLGPAEFLGLEKTIGSIEVGKVANLILFDGSPFEATTAINNVFLEGRPVYED